MSNLQSVRFKRDINMVAVEASLQEINENRFDDVFQVEMAPESFSLSLTGSVFLRVWRVSPRKLEWKLHYDPVLCWVVLFFMSKLIRTLEKTAKISDDGLEEKLGATCDLEYPTAESWFRAFEPNAASKQSHDDLIAYLKPITPQCFWTTK